MLLVFKVLFQSWVTAFMIKNVGTEEQLIVIIRKSKENFMTKASR